MRDRLWRSTCVVAAIVPTLALLWAAEGLAASGEPRASLPNLIVVFIDDMGWSDLSCFGGPEGASPHIDRLAREGVRFEQFYVNSPICSPSRCALLTGQYPQRWGIRSFLSKRKENRRRGMAQWLDPKAPTLARVLSEQGYATGHFGKWHLGGQRDVGEAPLITEYGFDESLTNFEGLGARVLPICRSADGSAPRRHALGSDRLGRGPIFWHDRAYVTRDFTEATMNFVHAAVARGEPFYANVWPDDVHTPMYPPLSDWGDGSPRARYLGVLRAMDEQLAPLFDLVRETDALRDNTLIIVCSDNGPEPGYGSAGRLRGSKATLYEAGIRSPLIVWGPGVLDPGSAGQVNRESVFAAFDLAPSILELFGISSHKLGQHDGEALVEVLRGSSRASRREPLFFIRPPDRNVFKPFGNEDLPDVAVRSGKWKLLCEFDGRRPQLYDLLADPGEKRNLVERSPTESQRLMASLLAWRATIEEERASKR